MVRFQGGKLAPRPHSRTLKLSRYLRDIAPPFPLTVAWDNPVANYPMYLNDQLGDCVFAAGGHMIQTWTANAGAEFSPTDAQVLAAYEAVGGYVPGDPSTDNGAAITDFLAYWQKTGMGGHTIDAWAQIDQTNIDEVKLAIYLFEGIDIGVNIYQSDMDQFNAKQDWNPSQKSWFRRLFSKDTLLGGHSIPVLAYESTGGAAVTWGAVQPFTWAWFAARCDEAYAAVSLDALAKNGQAANHLNLAQLESDIRSMKS